MLGRPADSPRLRDRLGYVTQSPSVDADLSVLENLRYFAEVLGAPRTDPARMVALVGLTGRAHHRIARLSGGQRARSRRPRRCSVPPGCWCSTNRPSGSIPRFGRSCGSCSTSWPRTAPRC